MRNSLRSLACILGLALFSQPLLAQEAALPPTDEAAVGLSAELGIEAGWAEDRLVDTVRGIFSWKGGPAELLVDFSMVRDGVYPSEQPFLLEHYFQINDSRVSLDFSPLSLKFGRMRNRDVIDNPYSVFLSSKAPAALSAELGLDSGPVFYSSRWIMLNARSDQLYANDTDGTKHWRDRGTNIKVFGLRLGDARLGFEESVVYLDRFFDAEYFLNPLPEYFVQLFTTSPGRPWVEQDNTNSLMGFFFDWDRDGLYLSSQFLLDDLNAKFLAPILGKFIPALYEVTNLTKIAWNLGARWDTPYGRFAFYQGGATKYTFASTYAYDSYDDLPYEYTYYPAVEYSRLGTMTALDYTDNYIGYLYGENSLSFRLDYGTTFLRGSAGEFDFSSSLEWVINGSKSPANPWHEHTDWTEIGPSIELLDEAVLEHILRLKLEAGKSFGDWRIGCSGTVGYVWNALDFVNSPAPANEPKIYTPNPLVDKAILQLSLGVTYSIGD
jgi:hypothetical protein